MDILTESGSSRFLTYDNEHDCAFISAFRVARDCGQGKKYTKIENLQRSSNLLAKLVTKGYGLASVLGQFRGGGQDSSERTFFVINLQDNEEFVHNIISYGEYFEQDAVMIIPKGALRGGGKSRAYYARTNECENNFLRVLNEKKKFFGRTLINREIEAFFTRVGGRAFDSLKVVKVLTSTSSRMSLMSRGLVAPRGLVAHAAKEEWKKTEILFLGSSRNVHRKLRSGFYDLPHGIPEHVDRDDVYDFVETIIEGFGGRNKLHRLTGAKGECYGVDWYGNYWIFLPMEQGATNGATSCHVTYHQDDDVYTVRFLRGMLNNPDDLRVISEHVGLDIYELKPLYQEQTDSYTMFD